MTEVKGKFLREWRQRQADKSERAINEIDERTAVRKDEHEQKMQPLNREREQTRSEAKQHLPEVPRQRQENPSTAEAPDGDTLLLRLVVSALAAILTGWLSAFPIGWTIIIATSLLGIQIFTPVIVMASLVLAVIPAFFVARKVDHAMKRSH